MTKQTQTGGSKVIEFRVSAPKTRAEEATLKTLEENGFWVRAVKSDGEYLWNDWEKVENGGTNPGGTLKYKYDRNRNVFVAELPAGAQFDLTWPDDEVSFYALNVNPFPIDNWVGSVTYFDNFIGKSGYNILKFTPDTQIASQVDLLCATNKGTSNDFGSTAIPLTFKHPLVQVEVQAKCESTAYYEVLVKGCKIHYLGPFSYNAFIFPKPVTYESQVAAHNLLSQPSGNWSYIGNLDIIDLSIMTDDNIVYDADNMSFADTDYFSNLYAGSRSYDLSDCSTKTPESDRIGEPWITLGDDPVKISFATSSTDLNLDVPSNAMLIPAPYVVDGFNDGYCKGTDKGAYLALLVQVNNKDGSAIFPGEDKNTHNRICYRNVPRYFGYVYVPITIDWRECAGKKVVYTLDLTDGIGRLDPTHTETVDPYLYDPDTDTNIGTGGTDPYTPKQEIIQHDMQIKAKVEGWTSTDSNSIKM